LIVRLEPRKTFCRFTISGSRYEEAGFGFPLLEPDEELLTALRSGKFLQWFNHRAIATYTNEKGEQGIVTPDFNLSKSPDSTNWTTVA
jgi:hypothetical protein